MKIEVSAALGKGPSKKTAFDSALAEVDMHNYNLVEFSSVIPPNAEVEVVESVEKSFVTGSAVSVVLSVDYSTPKDDRSAYAELCWNQSRSGSGYFIESTDGESVSKEELDHIESNREQSFISRPESVASVSGNTDEYNCSIVLGVYGRIDTEYNESPY